MFVRSVLHTHKEHEFAWYGVLRARIEDVERKKQHLDAYTCDWFANTKLFVAPFLLNIYHFIDIAGKLRVCWFADLAVCRFIYNTGELSLCIAQEQIAHLYQ